MVIRSIKTFFLIFTLIIVIILALSVPVSASNQPEYPTSYAGLPVIFVQTSTNTNSLPEGQTILILQDSISNTPQEAIARLESTESRMQLLPKGWSINIIGGPNTSQAIYTQLHKENQELTRNHPPIILGQSTLQTNQELNSLLWNPAQFNTFSIDRTKDPSTETITFLRAQWSSPVIGTHQTTYSALLLNGLTNVWYTPKQKFFFLQSGQGYVLSQGQNIWSDTSVDLVAQPFINVPYYANHLMQFYIGKTTSGWYMSARDMTNGNFDLHLETVATGGQLQYSWDTSVFFENNNANADWYVGFTQDILVNDAWDGISVPANIHAWLNDECTANNGHGIGYPNHPSITGSLKNFSTATFHLHLMLLWTP
jgi:hypothetical protein